MFPYTDAQTLLDLHRQRAADLRREADAARLARSASYAGRHGPARWWSRQPGRRRAVRAPVTP
jgi:hypothetical protein